MNKYFVFFVPLWLWFYAAQGQEQLPTIRLLPEDFVQESIKEVHWTTNTFAIKWKYTEAGAKKMVDFWGQHPGQKVCIQIGSYQTPPFVAPEPEDPVTHTDWKPGWLKRRTDQFINLNENDAKTIMTGMKSG